MQFTPKIQRAIERAAALHAGQTRRGSNVPYSVHSSSVACILSGYTQDEDVICAGALHDVFECVPDYLAEDMRKEFGPAVTALVEEATEQVLSGQSVSDPESVWRERKEKYLAGLETASSGALLICAAEKMHNLWAILDEYIQWHDDLRGEFDAPSEQKLWFFEEVVKVLKRRLDNPIVAELEALCREARELFAAVDLTDRNISEKLGVLLARELEQWYRKPKKTI
jgi:hypothetical protein